MSRRKPKSSTVRNTASAGVRNAAPDHLPRPTMTSLLLGHLARRKSHRLPIACSSSQRDEGLAWLDQHSGSSPCNHERIVHHDIWLDIERIYLIEDGA